MGKTDTQEKIGGRIDAVRVIGGFVGRFFKLKQGPRSLHALGEWTQ